MDSEVKYLATLVFDAAVDFYESEGDAESEAGAQFIAALEKVIVKAREQR